MTKERRNAGPVPPFSLGGEQAEADSLLQDGFYESEHYASIASRDDPHCFVLGRTGSGKSAILQRIEQSNADHVIRINPEDLSLPYIVDLDIIKYLERVGVKLDTFFIALWKHVLLIEIIKNRYQVNSPEEKKHFLAAMLESFRKDKSKTAALAYLEEFEGKFWCETDERIKDITRRFEDEIKSQADGKLGGAFAQLGGALGATKTVSEEVQTQLHARFQRVVNETQLPRLNTMITVLKEDILSSPQHYKYVLIDDLDRDWVDESLLNSLIRCLFRAVVDLKKVQNLKVLVALRTNILESLNFGDTGGQEEKYRSLTYEIRWNEAELRRMLSSRARAAMYRREGDRGRSVSTINELVPRVNGTMGDPLHFMISRTLLRPRDVVSFFNECFREADGRTSLTWDAIHSAELRYSTNRLLALRDEWKPSYPRVDLLFELFRRASPLMSRSEFASRLDDVALILADGHSEAVERWLAPLANSVWKNYGSADWSHTYAPLVQFLYKIGFVGCVSQDKKSHLVAVYDEPAYVSQSRNLAATQRFMVHPTFCRALDIDIDSIWSKGGTLNLETKVIV